MEVYEMHHASVVGSKALPFFVCFMCYVWAVGIVWLMLSMGTRELPLAYGCGDH
jgi:hypothetical protein